ncbi:hypothetical protein CDL15_Pgr008913 [Punica granatum]|uniref:WRKY domain-containing protein n=1 Tax=Punica granatum TaxID=22663 RepID=A0A218VYD4_PUNGR|nr:hypothetical protein CDL15_Pgr008913 [Punica granatum]
MGKRAQEDDIANGNDRFEEAFTKVENQSPMQNDNDNPKPYSPQQQPTSSKIENSPSEPDSMEQDDQLELARIEMGEVREENERLKLYLERIMKEYKALQIQFFDIAKQEDQKQQATEDTDTASAQELEESDLVSLSLGRVSGSSVGKDEKRKSLSGLENKDQKINEDREGLALSLDCKFGAAKSGMTESLPNNTSPENSLEDPKEDAGEPPSKVLKTMRSGDDEVSQQHLAKKARVCVRASCDTMTMNDGCRWRKYGQKIAKGNPCPRAYFRCTVAPSCSVRKQRCAEDMSILITTYEGTHNHPLPVSATAMASITSAAASMLLSGSSTSGSGQGSLPTATTTDLNGLNFYLSDPSRSKQYYLPNSSLMMRSPSHPTITLDLTSGPAITSSASSYLNRFASGTARYSSSISLNYRPMSEPSTLPISWGTSGLPKYGTTDHQPINKSNPQEAFLHHLPYLQKTNYNPQDSIAVATEAIITNPNFQSALTAALKSIICTGSSPICSGTALALGNFQGYSGEDVSGPKVKLE